MKRDKDLIRDLLFEFEAEEDWLLLFSNAINQTKEERLRLGHVQLLSDAGLLKQVNENGFRVTNAGFDYLDAIRDKTVWDQTKEAASSIGGATLSMMKDIAIAYLKAEAADKLGLNLK